MAFCVQTTLAVFVTAALVRLDLTTTHSFSHPGWELLVCVAERWGGEWGDYSELVGYWLRLARNLTLNAEDAVTLRGQKARRARAEALDAVRQLLTAGLARTTPTNPATARWAEQVEPEFGRAYHLWRTSRTDEQP